ncbi:hypothetical protein [Domibacillus tundrae]|uniref:hypothetical protein n=1 Tax=Domibacillus tundrae TaxID=1587527 RepID=UPI0033980637
MKGQTILVIAYRLSTAVHADQIIGLEHGETTSTGTHIDLFHSHPICRELAQKQNLQESMHSFSCLPAAGRFFFFSYSCIIIRKKSSSQELSFDDLFSQTLFQSDPYEQLDPLFRHVFTHFVQQFFHVLHRTRNVCIAF